jgi:hypothetical protein
MGGALRTGYKNFALAALWIARKKGIGNQRPGHASVKYIVQ